MQQRRYGCPDCGQRFTTYEIPEETWTTWRALARALRRGSGLVKAALRAVNRHD